MRKRIRACAAALTLAGGAAFLAQAAPARAPCCFTNAQYAGVCSVEPTSGETCAAILAYLNNPRSQGKSYCRNTSLRGGWQRRRCPRPTAVDSNRTIP